MSAQTQLSPRTRGFIRAVDVSVAGFARHWLLYVNLFMLVFMGLPFLAPVLMNLGYEGPARALYAAYSLTCHQLAYRTWFFFGAQPSYTVDQLQQYLHVTNPITDYIFWRNFVGNTEVGYKMAYCERNTAIYSSIFFAGFVYALLRTRLKPLNWKWYLLFAIVPMALDGFTQLFGLRESDPLLRTVTGTLFGAGSVWLIYPYIEEAMRDIYKQTSHQVRRLTASPGGG